MKIPKIAFKKKRINIVLVIIYLLGFNKSASEDTVLVETNALGR